MLRGRALAVAPPRRAAVGLALAGACLLGPAALPGEAAPERTASVARASSIKLIGDRRLEPVRDHSASGRAQAWSFRATASGRTRSASVYVDQGNRAARVRVALYENSGGEPGRLLVTGRRLHPAAGRWNTISIGRTRVSQGKRYWLALLGTGGALWFRDRVSRGCLHETTAKRDMIRFTRFLPRHTRSTRCPIAAYVSGSGLAAQGGATAPGGSGTGSSGNGSNGGAPPKGTPPKSDPAPVASAVPTISGQAMQGQTLSATHGTWSGTPSSYAYQWKDCDASGASCAAISGATGSSYLLAAADIDHTIRVAVMAANDGGATTAQSNATGKVAAVTGCFASPGRCGFPDPAVGNVGVPAGAALSSSGSLTVSTPGAVIQNLDVVGQITVAASDVTIRNVRVTMSGGSGAWGIFINKGASGTTIVDSTVRGAGAGEPNSIESAVWNHYDEPATAQRDYFYNCGDCWEGSGTIDDSYMIVNGLFSGAHYEDIYVCSSSVTANHDTLLNPQGQTATVFGDTICGGGNQFAVTNSLLAGGGFLLYPAANSSSVGSTSMTVTGNRFARCLGSPVYDSGSGGTSCSGGADAHGYFPNGGYFGSSAYIYCPPTAKQTWSNNVWDDNNAAVKC